MKNLLDNYTILSKNIDSNETLLQCRSKVHDKGIVLMKEINLSNVKEFKGIVESLDNQKYIKCEQILSLLDYETQIRDVDEEICYSVIVFYEQSDHSLFQEIETRCENGTGFAEAEIWSILYSLVQGLACLQAQGIGHGCITNEDIYISLDGQIKIVDPSLSSLTPYKNLENGYYYAPEMIENFGTGHQSDHQEVDIYKCDVFSLGMCLLQCCLLQSCEDCYDYINAQEPCIIPDILKEKFNRLVDQYSENLLNFLYGMLALNCDIRQNFKQLSFELKSIMGQPIEVKQNRRKCAHSVQACSIHDEENAPDNAVSQQGQKERQIVDIADQVHEHRSKLQQMQIRVGEQFEGSGNKQQEQGGVEAARKVQINFNSNYSTKQNNHHNYHEGNEQIFTDPKLLQMMQDDIQKIMSKRSQCY